MRVNDSQAYRKMDVTREHISCILELREILLSFQTGFNLVNATVVSAILEGTSGLEPSSSVITEEGSKPQNYSNERKKKPICSTALMKFFSGQSVNDGCV